MVRVFELPDSSDRDKLWSAKRMLVTGDVREFGHFWPNSTRASNARCHIYQCADLIELYCEAVVPARLGEPHFVAVMNRDDEPLVLFPFTIERYLNVKVLRFIDGGLSDINAPVLFEPTRNWSSRDMLFVWDNLRSILGFDIAMFEKIPSHVGDLHNPLASLKTSDDIYSTHALEVVNWDSSSPKRPHGRTTNRHFRRLSERGKISVELARSEEQYEIILEAMMRQKTRRYLETRGIDGLARPGYRPFLQKAGKYMSPLGPVCLFALKVDDTIIATLFGLRFNSRLYYFMPTFESGEWAAYSPSRILIDRVVEWCNANGVNLLDFGVGDEDYKLRYCNISTDLYRAEIASTVRGALFKALMHTKRRAHHYFTTGKKSLLGSAAVAE